MKKLISLLMIFLFLSGLLPASFQNFPAEGKSKKIVHRKIYRKIKLQRKARLKRKLIVAKAKRKLIKKAKRSIKIRRKISRRSLFPKTKKTGIVTQTYSLEEGFDELEADRIADALKTLGADSVSTNVENNTVTVKFKKNKLSSIRIIQKLKQLGYTIKQID